MSEGDPFMRDAEITKSVHVAIIGVGLVIFGASLLYVGSIIGGC